MQGNKIFFDTNSTIDNNTETVYIFLRDTSIYTKVTRQKMFDLDMVNGCFLQCITYNTREEVEKRAKAFAQAINAREVEAEEFIKIEKLTENRRVAHAFNVAERMIRGC